MTDDLITWLRAQLDEDERRSLEMHYGECDNAAACGHDGCTCPLPDWIQADVRAKRRIIDLHPLRVYTDEEPGYSQVLNDHVCPGDQTPCTTLRLLALPFADRPGYREGWAP